jgi:hypothetical protein
MRGAIKINLRKIKQIKRKDQGLRFNQGFIWVQLGDRYTAGCNLEARKSANSKSSNHADATWRLSIGPTQP